MRTLRPTLLLIGALGLVGALAPQCDRGPDPAGPLNVVIVVLDTLRPDHLGAYGYGRPTSPRLDELLEGCVVFENAQSSAPWTAPALLTLMTSLHPGVHGVLRFPNPGRMSEKVLTLPEILRERGYRTAAFTEGGYAKGEFGLDQGFEVYPGFPGDESSHTSNATHPSRLEENLTRALDWLGERGNEPFLMLFHTYEIHAPFRAPAEFVRTFRPGWDEAAEHERVELIERRWNEEREIEREDVALLYSHRWHCERVDLSRLQGLGRYLGEQGLAPDPALGYHPETLEFIRDQYDAEIRFTDDRLARLWAALDERDTVLVLVSDHGEGLGERATVGHGKYLHEELLRVLLAIRAPGLEPGRVARPVATLDVMPTLLELLDVGTVARLQGKSLVPLMRDPARSGERDTYSQALSLPGEEDRWHALRRGRWRWVADARSGEGQLFDLEADPGETRDVKAQHPEQAAELKRALEKLRALDEQLAGVVSGEVDFSDLPKEILDELRALGYIDGEDDEQSEPEPEESSGR